MALWGTGVRPLLETGMGKERQGLAFLSFVANCGEDNKGENTERPHCKSLRLSVTRGGM